MSEDLNTMAAMWAKGSSSRDIARKLNCTRNAVLGLVHRNRDKFPARRLARAPSKPWTDEENTLIYQGGLTGRPAAQTVADLAVGGRNISPATLVNRPDWLEGNREFHRRKREAAAAVQEQRAKPDRNDVVRWRHPETGDHISLPKLACQAGWTDGKIYHHQATGAR